MHPTEKKSALEVVMTMLHAGGKFGGGGYKVSGGLHGVGVSAVNALSEWCEVEVSRDGKVYFQRYERGYPAGTGQGDRQGQGRGNRHARPPSSSTRTIFKGDLDYRFDTLVQRFREMAFVTRGVTIYFVDERTDREMTFYFEGGITSFVRYLNRNRETLHPVVYVEKEVDGIGIEAAIQYTDAYAESVYSFANTINTVDGGTHLTGLRAALTRVINDYARKQRPAQGSRPELLRRRHARGPDRHRQRQAPRPAVREPDQGQADEPRGADLRPAGGGRGLRHLPGGEPAGGQGDRRRSASPPPARATRPARRATWSSASRRWRA